MRLWVHRGNWHTGLPPRMGIATEVVVHLLEPAGVGPEAQGAAGGAAPIRPSR